MISKLKLAVGIGVGYVLGSRAGTQRYDQIMAKAREFSGRPAVQKATSSVQQTAGVLADRARSTVNNTVHTVMTDKNDTSGTVVDLSNGNGPVRPSART